MDTKTRGVKIDRIVSFQKFGEAPKELTSLMGKWNKSKWNEAHLYFSFKS